MRCLIRADGSTVDLPGPVSSDEIATLIGADCLDTVTMRHMGHPLHVMCVNDHGYEVQSVETELDGAPVLELRPVRALLPLNVEATRLYHLNCRAGTEYQIVGDVVICPDDDFIVASER